MLTQSLAREFGPQGIHVAHVIIDGIIEGEKVRTRFPDYIDGLGEDVLKISATAGAFSRSMTSTARLGRKGSTSARSKKTFSRATARLVVTANASSTLLPVHQSPMAAKPIAVSCKNGCSAGVSVEANRHRWMRSYSCGYRQSAQCSEAGFHLRGNGIDIIFNARLRPVMARLKRRAIAAGRPGLVPLKAAANMSSSKCAQSQSTRCLSMKTSMSVWQPCMLTAAKLSENPAPSGSNATACTAYCC